MWNKVTKSEHNQTSISAFVQDLITVNVNMQN